MSNPGLVVLGGMQFELTHVINPDYGKREDVVGVMLSQRMALSLMGALLAGVSLDRDPIHVRIKGQVTNWPGQVALKEGAE